MAIIEDFYLGTTHIMIDDSRMYKSHAQIQAGTERMEGIMAKSILAAAVSLTDSDRENPFSQGLTCASQHVNIKVEQNKDRLL